MKNTRISENKKKFPKKAYLLINKSNKPQSIIDQKSIKNKTHKNTTKSYPKIKIKKEISNML